MKIFNFKKDMEKAKHQVPNEDPAFDLHLTLGDFKTKHGKRIGSRLTCSKEFLALFSDNDVRAQKIGEALHTQIKLILDAYYEEINK